MLKTYVQSNSEYHGGSLAFLSVHTLHSNIIKCLDVFKCYFLGTRLKWMFKLRNELLTITCVSEMLQAGNEIPDRAMLSITDKYYILNPSRVLR